MIKVNSPHQNGVTKKISLLTLFDLLEPAHWTENTFNCTSSFFMAVCTLFPSDLRPHLFSIRFCPPNIMALIHARMKPTLNKMNDVSVHSKNCFCQTLDGLKYCIMPFIPANEYDEALSSLQWKLSNVRALSLYYVFIYSHKGLRFTSGFTSRQFFCPLPTNIFGA